MPAMLEGPPPLPPDVTSQQGPSDTPFAGVGKMMSEQGEKGSETPIAAHPQGALKTKADAVKKVLETMVQSAKAGKAFLSRAIELVDKALEAEGKSSSQGSSQPELMKPPSAKPPESGTQSPAFPG